MNRVEGISKVLHRTQSFINGPKFWVESITNPTELDAGPPPRSTAEPVLAHYFAGPYLQGGELQEGANGNGLECFFCKEVDTTW